MTDDLERFVIAQDACWETVIAELRAAKKEGCWIWFVFPQIAGLGKSDMSKYYAIRSLDEARAYLAHKDLGPRLQKVAELLLAAPADRSAVAILDDDAKKVRSSMTLFRLADPSETIFQAVLDRFYAGGPVRLRRVKR